VVALVVAEAWPQEDGSLRTCSKVSSLRDGALARGRCHGLVKTQDLNALECQESCRSDPLCSTWRFSLASQCWQGSDVKCTAGKDEDLLVTGSERLQHGDVSVVQELRGMGVQGLETWSATREDCRSWCYSNIKCRYWLHDGSSCRAENNALLLTASDHPERELTTDTNITSGEYIQHFCSDPQEPALLQMFSEEDLETQVAGLDWKWDVAMFFLMAFLLGRAVYAMKRDPEDQLREDSSSGTDEESAQKLDVLRVWWQLPFAPMLAWFQPGQLEHIIHGPFATRAERRAVAAVAPATPVMLANFLAWRRVTISALFSFGLVHYAMQCRILCSTWRHHLYFNSIGMTPSLADYEVFAASHVGSNFLQYSKAKMLSFLAGIVAEALRGAFVVELIVFIVEFSPLVMLVLALLNWTSFTRSRRCVLNAWLVAFITPFAVSLFPARLMLSFNRTEIQIDNYVHELAVSLHLDKVQELVLESCGDLNEDVASFKENLQKTCSTLAHLPPHLTLPCIDSMALCHADLDSVVGQCNVALKQVEMGHIDQATGILKQQCKMLKDAFTRGGEGRTGRSEAFKVLLGMMKAPIHFLMPEVEGVSMTVSALHACFMVLPPVLATVPGFLCAALATKVLLPHSGVPGAILITVPVILASAAFLVCTILFQYVSDLWILAFLMVCLTGLLALLAVGAFHNFSQPSPREVVRQGLARLVSTTQGIVLLLAVLCLGILHDLRCRIDGILLVESLPDAFAWCDVSWARLGLACAMHTLYNFMLTTFAVTDKLISDISAEQHYWTFFVKEEFIRKPATSPSPGLQGCHGERTPFRHHLGNLSSVRFDSLASSPRFDPLSSALASPIAPDPWAFSQAVLDKDLCEMLKHRVVAEQWEQDSKLSTD